jgi:predicted HTH transcriptional regulator
MSQTSSYEMPAIIATSGGNMGEALLLVERVRNTISLGESHFREFKSAFEGRPAEKRMRPVARVCRDIGEAHVAFANADGGELIVGVERESGKVRGFGFIYFEKAESAERALKDQPHFIGEKYVDFAKYSPPGKKPKA